MAGESEESEERGREREREKSFFLMLNLLCIFNDWALIATRGKALNDYDVVKFRRGMPAPRQWD